MNELFIWHEKIVIICLKTVDTLLITHVHSISRHEIKWALRNN